MIKRNFKKIVFSLLMFLFMAVNVNAISTQVDTTDELLEAVKNSGEIQLSGNINFGEFTGAKIIINAGTEVTLDLNGYTISGKSSDEKANAMIIQNNGTLIIEDSSTAGTGKITMGDTAVSLWVYKYGAYTISNRGVLVVNSGTIENTGKTDVPYPIDNNSADRNATVTINGGRIISGKAAVRGYCTSTTNENNIIINGGYIEGGTSAVWISQVNEKANKGYLEVNGGTLYGKKYNGIYVTVFNQALFSNIQIKITGGLIKNNSETSATLMYEPWDDISDLANANLDLEITGGRFINENANGRAFVQPEYLDVPVTYTNIIGGVYSSDVSQYINTGSGAVSKIIDNLYAVGIENKINVKDVSFGKVLVDKTKAIIGETITIATTPSEGYETSTIKVFDDEGNELEVTNNQFLMPNVNVTIDVEFTRLIKTDNLPVIDQTEEVKEITFGVTDKDKVDSILYETILKDEKLSDKIENERVTVEVEIDSIDSSTIAKEVAEVIKTKAGKAVVANYFDISIAVKNATGTINESISQLTKEIELMIALPKELRNTSDDINRKYYIVREHNVDGNSQVDLLEAKLSKDGKYLTFKTDKFSTYALAYEDIKIASNPDTNDNIELYITIGFVSLLVLGVSVKTLKRRYLQ